MAYSEFYKPQEEEHFEPKVVTFPFSWTETDHRNASIKITVVNITSLGTGNLERIGLRGIEADEGYRFYGVYLTFKNLRHEEYYTHGSGIGAYLDIKTNRSNIYKAGYGYSSFARPPDLRPEEESDGWIWFQIRVDEKPIELRNYEVLNDELEIAYIWKIEDNKIIRPTISTSTTVGGFNVTVLQAQWKDSLDGYDPERENGSFLLVTLTVENTAKESYLFGVIGEYFGVMGTVEVAIIDAESYAYPSFSKVPLPGSKITWTVLPQKIDPKMSKQWIIAFEVPKDAEDLKLGLRTAKDQPWTLLKLETDKYVALETLGLVEGEKEVIS